MQPSRIADVELTPEGAHRTQPVRVPHLGLGDVGHPLASCQKLGDRYCLLRDQGRLEAADPVECRARPGSSSVGAKPGVAAVPRPIREAADMARAGVAEFPPDTLKDTVALAGQLAGVGDRSLAPHDRRGQDSRKSSRQAWASGVSITTIGVARRRRASSRVRP